MKIAILGAGVIGVTTAYFLAKNGHFVTVIDRSKESASECSFANGGQLSYTHAEPWATPAMLKKAFKWLGKKEAPLLFNFRLDPDQWKWIFKYMLNCKQNKVEENTKIMLRLGMYSRLVMQELQQELNLDFDYLRTGILHIFKNREDMDKAVSQSEFQKTLGTPYEKLRPEQCVEKEPALKSIAKKLVGGIYYSLDESGDVHKFTAKLAEECNKMGVEFRYSVDINEIAAETDKVHSVITNRGAVYADKYIVCLGSYSPLFLRKIAIKVPIYPLKGYSISIPVDGSAYDEVPTMSITDQAEKTVFSRLGNVLRVAGTAEFAGYNQEINPLRVDMLSKVTVSLFPHCRNLDKAEQWACLRPATPSGVPILGKTKYNNLLLNTGHGTLGWTQAAGSAKIISQLVDEQRAPIDISGMTAEKY